MLDPDAMFARLQIANLTCDLLEARAAARQLAGWILHGGAPPTGMAAHHALDRCRQTEAWADRMLGQPDREKAEGGAIDCGGA